jgi:hypothetical protein
MPTVPPRTLLDQKRLEASLLKAKRALKPDVIRIMYSFEEDWTGEPSLFFRVLITDAASDPKRLLETVRRIETKVLRETKADERGLQTYFNFRNESEQAQLRDPIWEP